MMTVNTIKRRTGLALAGGAIGMTAALTVGVGTAYATSTYLPGAWTNVTSQNAQVCSTTYLSATLWYAYAAGSGGEVGTSLVAPPNQCRTAWLLGSWNVRHFHLCNGFGECTREYWL
jgi:hypothetical protein